MGASGAQSWGRGLGGATDEVTEAQGGWDLLKVTRGSSGAARRTGSGAGRVRSHTHPHPVSNWLLFGGYASTEGRPLTGRKEQGLRSPHRWIHLF